MKTGRRDVAPAKSMNNQYVEPKTQPTKHREKVLRIFRPLAGAIIGLFSIPIMVRLLLWDTQSTSFFSIVLSCLGFALLSPGNIVSNHIFGGAWWYGTDQGYFAQMLPDVITWGISVTPPIIIGFLIGP